MPCSRQGQGLYTAALLNVGALRAEENGWIPKKISKGSPQTSVYYRKQSLETNPVHLHTHLNTNTHTQRQEQRDEEVLVSYLLKWCLIQT